MSGTYPRIRQLASRWSHTFVAEYRLSPVSRYVLRVFNPPAPSGLLAREHRDTERERFRCDGAWGEFYIYALQWKDGVFRESLDPGRSLAKLTFEEAVILRALEAALRARHPRLFE